MRPFNDPSFDDVDALMDLLPTIGRDMERVLRGDGRTFKSTTAVVAKVVRLLSLCTFRHQTDIISLSSSL